MATVQIRKRDQVTANNRFIKPLQIIVAVKPSSKQNVHNGNAEMNGTVLRNDLHYYIELCISVLAPL